MDRSPRELRAWLLTIARYVVLELASRGQARNTPHRKTTLPQALIGSLSVREDGRPNDEGAARGLKILESPLTSDRRGEFLSGLGVLYGLRSRQRMCVVLREVMDTSWGTVGFVLDLQNSAARQLYRRVRGERVQRLR